jgi:ABC-type phosphate/phosphonate transport system substrate-binding protein
VTSTLIAALPMYDLAEIAAAQDAWWHWLAQRLLQSGVRDVPRTLSRDISYTDSWGHPGLLFGQGCEYPLATSHADVVRVLGTPCYAADGCEGHYYRSALVVRTSERAEQLQQMRGRRCAVNDMASNSGMNLLRAAVAPLAGGKAFFGTVTISGSHWRSVEMIAAGQADLAAIDCVSWAHFGRHRARQVAGLRVLGWSASSPCLPLITARFTDEASVAALRAALADAGTDSALHEVRRQLLLERVDAPDDEPYAEVRRLASGAAALGYAELH